MRTIKMKCDNCGAYLDVDENRTQMFCSFCGAKMLIDDEVIRKIMEEHIIIEDKGRIREAEASEKVSLNRIMAKAQSMNMNQLLVVLGSIWGLIIILGLIIVALLK